MLIDNLRYVLSMMCLYRPFIFVTDCVPYFGGQELGLCLAMCETQASKRNVESLLKDKRSCFSPGERFAHRFAVRLPLDRALALRK